MFSGARYSRIVPKVSLNPNQAKPTLRRIAVAALKSDEHNRQKSQKARSRHRLHRRWFCDAADAGARCDEDRNTDTPQTSSLRTAHAAADQYRLRRTVSR